MRRLLAVLFLVGCFILPRISQSQTNYPTVYTFTDGSTYSTYATELVNDGMRNGRSVASVVIGSEVTSLGRDAFAWCGSLTNINIPDKVTTIGEGALAGTAITKITISTNVTSIGISAFQACASLSSITIPNSVTSIGRYAFLDCSALKVVTIGQGVANFGHSVFANCGNLTEVRFYGNAPTLESGGDWVNCSAKVFRISDAIGWGATFAGRPISIISNLAVGKTVTASSVYEDMVNFSADRVVNGSSSETSGSFWLAKGTYDTYQGTLPAWVTIDLGQSYPVIGVSILNAKNSPYNDRGSKDISIQISTNGINYFTVATNRLAWQNTSFQDQPFNGAVTARYVKINVNSAYGNYEGAALNEVRVDSSSEITPAYSLWAVADPIKGLIDINPAQPGYLSGEIVTLTATALPGYIFSGWSGDLSGSTSSSIITMDSNKEITASFSQDLNDDDSDGLTNYQEIIIYGTDPLNKDSNSDEIEDGQAVALGYSPLFNFGPLITFLRINPPVGLYTTNQIHNLGLGGIMLNRNTNNQLVLNYQILQSTDLQNWSSYQNNELVISNAPSDKMFLRVQAVGQ